MKTNIILGIVSIFLIISSITSIIGNRMKSHKIEDLTFIINHYKTKPVYMKLVVFRQEITDNDSIFNYCLLNEFGYKTIIQFKSDLSLHCNDTLKIQK